MPRKIIVTGGTGFIGRSLCAALARSDDDVIVLSRHIHTATEQFGTRITPVFWDGTSVDDWIKYVEGAYAIINLAGENIGSGRWTRKKKQRILDSRLHAGRAIVAAIRQVSNKPKILLQASGIGIYGDRRDELLDESSAIGKGFLPQLANQWEQSVQEVATMGVRLVYLRTGVVLSKDADFMKRVVPLFRFFLGGHLGSGKQWISWIHLDDEVAAITFLLERNDLAGAFNLSAPHPLTYNDFFKTLGSVMKRPSWFHVPEFMLKIILGEMAEGLILSGQRAIPQKLLQAGFQFKHPALENALTEILR